MAKSKQIEALKNWNDLNEVALRCLTDAVECLASIEIVERGNKPAAIDAMAKAGAFQAAIHMRDATLFRLHIIVCRAYAPVNHEDDRHARTAIDFLRAHIDEETDAGLRRHLRKAIEQFEAIEVDPRRLKLSQMRNKLIAHITKPDPAVSIATYWELFEITKATAEMWHSLAQGAGQATLRLDFFLTEYRYSLAAFWSRWSEPEA